MAARTKTAITAECRKLVTPYHISIDGTDDNPGNLVNMPNSVTPVMVCMILVLLCLEVLLNIRNGETA